MFQFRLTMLVFNIVFGCVNAYLMVTEPAGFTLFCFAINVALVVDLLHRLNDE